MSYIADISIPASAFALAETLEAAPTVRVEVDQCATHGTGWVLPTIWVSGDGLEAFDEAIQQDPTVTQIVEKERFETATCYTLEWSAEVVAFVDTILSRQATMLAAETQGTEWRLRIRFVSHEQLECFWAYFADSPESFTLRELFSPNVAKEKANQLTPGQREVLLEAANSGYYAIPRQATCAELAEEFDVSHQAISEKLRRGTANLIKATLPTEERT